MKPSVHQFGASGIFVISDSNNIERRQRFVEDWSNVSNFDYEFVDATMGSSIDVSSLINEGRLTKFWCGEGGVSKNVIACFLSHRKVWKSIKDLPHENYYLILEDDVRLTPYFLNTAFSNGEFKKVLNNIHKEDINCFWWGRADNKVIGKQYNKHLKVPDAFIALGAHSYMITPGFANYLYSESFNISCPADVFIDLLLIGIKRHYTPNFSYMRQMQHMIKDRFFPLDHKYRVWGSTTQPDWTDHTTRVYEGLYKNVSPDIRKFITDASQEFIAEFKKGISFKFEIFEEKELL